MAREERVSDGYRRMSLVLAGVPLTALVIGVVLAVGIWCRVAWICAPVARAQGNDIWVEPAVVKVGCGRSNAADAHITIRNYRERPIQIVGAEVSCRCTMLEGVPVTLAPNQHVQLTIAVDEVPERSEFTGRIVFLANDGGKVTYLPVRLECGS